MEKLRTDTSLEEKLMDGLHEGDTQASAVLLETLRLLVLDDLGRQGQCCVVSHSTKGSECSSQCASFSLFRTRFFTCKKKRYIVLYYSNLKTLLYVQFLQGIQPSISIGSSFFPMWRARATAAPLRPQRQRRRRTPRRLP